MSDPQSLPRQSGDVPRRSDVVHCWLERMRDQNDRGHPAWIACDWLVGEYERRADAGVTLDAKDDRSQRGMEGS